jgi:hypothetical protein
MFDCRAILNTASIKIDYLLALILYSTKAVEWNETLSIQISPLCYYLGIYSKRTSSFQLSADDSSDIVVIPL